MTNLSKILLGTLIFSNLIFANMEICKTSSTICSEIEKNTQIMNNHGYGKKKRLLAISRISRRVGTLSTSDNNSLKNRLKSIPLFTSAITGKKIFMTLSSPCEAKGYIVEIGFDRNYNLDFSEFRYNTIEKYNGALYLDRERFPLKDSVNMKYRDALASVITKKEKKVTKRELSASKPILHANNMLCTTAPLKFRDANDASKILTILKKGSKVRILSQEEENRNGINSYIALYNSKLGYLAVQYLGACQ